MSENNSIVTDDCIGAVVSRFESQHDSGLDTVTVSTQVTDTTRRLLSTFSPLSSSRSAPLAENWMPPTLETSLSAPAQCSVFQTVDNRHESPWTLEGFRIYTEQRFSRLESDNLSLRQENLSLRQENRSLRQAIRAQSAKFEAQSAKFEA
jgi:hypothetical protein